MRTENRPITDVAILVIVNFEQQGRNGCSTGEMRTYNEKVGSRSSEHLKNARCI